MLALRLMMAGADVLVRTRATGLIVEDGVVNGVKIKRLGESLEVRSKVVIGADGVESRSVDGMGSILRLSSKTLGSAFST
jgi:digeranylgeranylglycerophospholipid reductase